MPIALAAGAVLGALVTLSPWVVCLLLGGVGLPNRLRFALLGMFSLVLLRSALLPDVFSPHLGSVVQLEGVVRNGLLYSQGDRLYVRHFPPLADGRYVVRGTLGAPQTQRNPGGFSAAGWLRGLGVKAVLDVEQVVGFKPLPNGVTDRFRAALQNGLAPQASGLATALSLGETEGLGELEAAFRQAGLAHALALSGLNVGILVGVVLLLLAPLGYRRYWVALPVAWAYIFLAGPSPSLVRASLMATVVLLLLALGKGRGQLLMGLALALALHLLYEPFALFSLSFQLSYLAVLGLVAFLGHLNWPKGWKGWVGAAFATTVAAQALLLPLLLHNFNTLPLLSPVANLVVMPLLNLLVPLSFFKGLLADAGGWLTPLVQVFSDLAIGATQWLAAGPQLSWGQISWAGFALYYLGLLPLALAWWRKLDWKTGVLLASVAVVASAGPQLARKAQVWQLDVGQGDASLVLLPSGASILVDGGRSWGANRVVRAAFALGLNKLDLVVATHPDADHLEALPEILQRMPVGVLLMGPPKPHDRLDALVRQVAHQKGVKVWVVRAGAQLSLGGARLHVWGPTGSEDNDNEGSVVVLLDYRGRKALFTGDAGEVTEQRWPAQPVHILKVGHHGSKHSTSEALLKGLRPKVALVGVGSNNYGHPHPEVLQRLQRYGARVYRTDLEGAIRVQFW